MISTRAPIQIAAELVEAVSTLREIQEESEEPDSLGFSTDPETGKPEHTMSIIIIEVVYGPDRKIRTTFRLQASPCTRLTCKNVIVCMFAETVSVPGTLGWSVTELSKVRIEGHL